MKAALVLAAISLGCGGARSWIIAPRAEVPISMSDGLRAVDGHLLVPQEKHVVGEFSLDYKPWSMLFRLISFTGDKDISDEVNKQVKVAGGDAINNLQVFSGNCTWNVFTLVGVLPDCANVSIRGDIIKVSGNGRRVEQAQREVN